MCSASRASTGEIRATNLWTTATESRTDVSLPHDGLLAAAESGVSRAAGTREVGSGQVPLADKSWPGYLNSRGGAPCASWGEPRTLVRPEGRGTATGMQPECPGPAPSDSHDAVGQPTSLGCVRASRRDVAHGRGSRDKGGSRSDGSVRSRGLDSPRNVCPPDSPTTRGGPVRELVEEAERSGGRWGGAGSLPRPSISRCCGAIFVVASGE
jgi:hypothetical protein